MRPRRFRSLVAFAIAVVSACAEPAESTIQSRPAMLRMLAPYAIDLQSAPTEVAMLAWQAPRPDCAPVFRITTHHQPPLKFEDDSTSWLVLGVCPDQPAIEGPIPSAQIVAGRVHYHGFRAEREGATRGACSKARERPDVSYARELFGPASPTAGCLAQTWDPIDDALALGWPRVPGRLVAVGERWNGLRVEAKCNKAACVDPQTGAAGPENHHRACVTQDWQEQLLGIYEHDDERFAWIRSTWTDGHEGQGIDTERFTLVSIDHGRPLWSQTRVDHRFVQPTADGAFNPVVRTWQIEAIDECPGSLLAAGWARPDDLAAQVETMRERLSDLDKPRRKRTPE